MGVSSVVIRVIVVTRRGVVCFLVMVRIVPISRVRLRLISSVRRDRGVYLGRMVSLSVSRPRRI